MEFSSEDRLFLAAICTHFHTRGYWPTYDYLDRILTAGHEDLDVEVIGYRLEPFMFDGPYAPMSGWDPHRETFLAISALYTCVTEGICPEMAEDLDAFMTVCQLAVDKYSSRDHGSEQSPQISSDELRDTFWMSDLVIHKVYDMFLRANLTVGSTRRDASSGQPEWWSVAIAPEVRKYRGVKTIEDFLRVRERNRAKERLMYRTPSTLLGGGAVLTPSDSVDLFSVPAASDAATIPVAKLNPISLFPAGPFSRKEHLCFVLMPFAAALRQVYEDAIVPAAIDAGLECQRADEIMKPGGVMAQVWQALMEAQVVVADLTQMNPNVFYELGLAHTIGHDVILLTQDREWVPFDLQHMRWFQYHPDEHGLKLLQQKLCLAFKAVLAETATHTKKDV